MQLEIRMVNEFFSAAAPELWNNLPEDIKSANSIDDFKRKIFMGAYESWRFYLLSDFFIYCVHLSFL